MAVVHENSTQAVAKLTGKMLGAFKDQSSVLRLQFNHTQVVAGDATSQQKLCFIPPGIYRFNRGTSHVFFSAFGAARTLDIGWLAHVDRNGTVVAASANGLNAAADVSAAGTAVIGTAIAIGWKDFESRDGIWIVSAVAGGTIPAAATLNGNLDLAGS